jgi:ankyrin repeat domain-containing protein 17
VCVLQELLDKCGECIQEIRAAKDMQAAKASMNADNLLEELDQEKTREESKKAAAARRRERKKKKKLEKKEEKRKANGDEDNDESGDDDDDKDDPPEDERTKTPPAVIAAEVAPRNEVLVDKEEGDSGIDANSQGSCSSNDVKAKEKRKEKKKKNKNLPGIIVSTGAKSDKENSPVPILENEVPQPKPVIVAPVVVAAPKEVKLISVISNQTTVKLPPMPPMVSETSIIINSKRSIKASKQLIPHLMFEAAPKPQPPPQQHPAEREDFEATGNETYIPSSKSKKSATYLSSNK